LARADYTTDITGPDVRRLRVAWQATSDEVMGVDAPAENADGMWTPSTLLTALAGVAEVPVEAADGTVGLRPLARSRTVFLADDTSVALAYGVAASRGLLDHTEQLAMTAGLVADVYGGAVTDAELAAAGYVHSDGDDAWWIPSGTALYPADPAAGFYLPTGSRDLFGNANA